MEIIKIISSAQVGYLFQKNTAMRREQAPALQREKYDIDKPLWSKIHSGFLLLQIFYIFDKVYQKSGWQFIE